MQIRVLTSSMHLTPSNKLVYARKKEEGELVKYQGLLILNVDFYRARARAVYFVDRLTVNSPFD